MWFFAGILLAVVLILLMLWLRNRKIAITWYEWLICALGLALLLIALQNYFAASAGYEPTAPGMFLLIFGLPAVIILIITVGLVCWHYFKTNKARSVPDAIANCREVAK